MTSIRLKIEESWYASMDCKVQKSGPWVCFYGGHSTGYKLGNHPKNIEPCAHRARTVRQRPHSATAPLLWGAKLPDRPLLPSGGGGVREAGQSTLPITLWWRTPSKILSLGMTERDACQLAGEWALWWQYAVIMRSGTNIPLIPRTAFSLSQVPHPGHGVEGFPNRRQLKAKENLLLMG